MAPSGASSGEQVSRRWPGLSGARHASVLLARRKTTGGGVEMGWADFCSRPHR